LNLVQKLLKRRDKMDSRLVQNSPMAIEKNMDLFDKCYKFTKAKELMAAGMYPYFRVIESAQDPEVMINGRKMIMVGSNNYLGLTNHPKVKKLLWMRPGIWFQAAPGRISERHTGHTCQT
jgi:hypothetical protein